MISFIVPARNEELWIGQCLASIRSTMEKIGGPYEVIVVDDTSTDATPQIAGQMRARLVRVEHHCLPAARNAGAREARGDVFFFIAADTLANERAVAAALHALASGAVGGGCVFAFDRPLPLWGRILYPLGVALGRLIRWGAVSSSAPGKVTRPPGDSPSVCTPARISLSFRRSSGRGVLSCPSQP